MQKFEQIIKDPYNTAMELPTEELVSVLEEFSRSYYNTGKPMVSDEVYDLLYGVLSQKDPMNKFLFETGAKLDKDMVQLPCFMPKLSKVKAESDVLSKWREQYRGPYVVSEKLDGTAALFHKTEDGLLKLYSRGDGCYGQDISALIPYVIPVTAKIQSIPKGSIIRGELILSKDDFNTLSGTYKNARNAVSGLVNCKTLGKRLDLANKTQFIAHELIEPGMVRVEQMVLLAKWGFSVVNHQVITDLNTEWASQYLQERRTESEFKSDGLVIADSSKIYENSLDVPDHLFAFKMILTDQVFESIVVDVIWTASGYNYLKPRVQIEPVSILGVEIRFASGFNAKYIVQNCIGPGAVVKIIRSGDVIPDIQGVITPALEPKLPTVPYKWTESNVDIIALEDDVSSISKRITHFFKKLDVKGVGEGTIKKLVQANYLSLFEIIRDRDQLCQIKGLGKKTIDQMFNGLTTRLSEVSIAEVMAASCIFGRGFGVRLAKSILDTYPDIMSEKWSQEEMILKVSTISGFAEKTATRFAEHFEEFKIFYGELSKLIPHTTKSPKDSIGVSPKSSKGVSPETIDYAENKSSQFDKFYRAKYCVLWISEIKFGKTRLRKLEDRSKHQFRRRQIWLFTKIRQQQNI